MASPCSGASLKIQGLDAASLSHAGLVISPRTALVSLGYKDLSSLASCAPKLINGDIQSAAHGIIQDPAGSAVGAMQDPAKLSGVGGASQAIYAAFPDLKPIPQIPVGASVFNSSTGAGRRVLHTYSPTLAGSPADVDDCQAAVEHIANAYRNALLCCNNPPAALSGSQDADVVNLIPVSGAIFAGPFRYHFASLHLHPSYTLVAIALAQLSLLQAGSPVLPATLYYHDQPVYAAAVPLLSEIYSSQG